jgi:hypothetical protein
MTLAIISIAIIILLSSANASPQIIKRSVLQGDEIYDPRLPVEACNSLAKEIQDSKPNLNCQLSDSKRIDSYHQDFDRECVDGASIAGCFSCTFECK